MSPASYPQSPCVGLCQMDGQRRFCLGCGRTLGEIANWSRMGVDDKRAVLQRLGQVAVVDPARHRAE
ncbi:DUF1289 domain-containing protein [Aquisalimonas sp.]|uniref:DUF1289 domain-containing protein n=1 Tax=Aquisalimonas sp. TaxID=1872621 RepID=UPI0025C28AE0|nr:DUF1289 domain-containing protein [Aquisalimonas sp.]